MSDTDLPFATRKMLSDSKREEEGDASASQLGFSEIFDQLSALSKDISRNLHAAKESAEQRQRAAAHKAKDANSLRQMAMKNAKLLAAAAATPEKN